MAVVTAAGLAGLVEPLLSPHHAGANAPLGNVKVSFAATGEHHHDDTDADATPLNSSTAALLSAQLAEARKVTARWPTVADAVAAGWTLAAPYASHVGAHYMHYSDIDSVFDISHPEMLLYGGDAPNSPIVGVTYYVRNRKPSGFSGSTDHWHQHPDVCIGPSGPLVGADGIGICATSRTKPGQWAWMLHVWVAPGWKSPQGVFSAENLALP